MSLFIPRTILITGASSGIGAALAKLYARRQIQLYLTGRNEERLEAVAKTCRQRGASVVTSLIDVTESSALSSWIHDIDRKTPIDLVIANAGISAGTSGHGENWAQVEAIFRTNIDGVLNTIQPIIPHMKQRGRGQVALVASLAGIRGLPSSPAYSASKACVRVYGEGLRGYLKQFGIRVNVISPGFIRTPMTDVNNYRMPGMMSATRAAKIIQKGLMKDKPSITFPWYMNALLWCFAALPQGWTDPLFARLPGKASLAKNEFYTTQDEHDKAA